MLYNASRRIVAYPQCLKLFWCSLKYPPVINNVTVHKNEELLPNKFPNGNIGNNTELISSKLISSILYCVLLIFLQTRQMNGESNMTAKYLFTNQ